MELPLHNAKKREFVMESTIGTGTEFLCRGTRRKYFLVPPLPCISASLLHQSKIHTEAKILGAPLFLLQFLRGVRLTEEARSFVSSM